MPDDNLTPSFGKDLLLLLVMDKFSKLGRMELTVTDIECEC
jgi:hypothetical protein